MDSREYEKIMVERQRVSQLRVPFDAWYAVRVDGRGFTRFVEQMDAKRPFDDGIVDGLIEATRELLEVMEGVYAYQQSDEISVVVPPFRGPYGRRCEKLSSVAAGVTSAECSVYWGRPVVFDGRVWTGNDDVQSVVDYLSWRRADARRNGISSAAYWGLIDEGMTSGEATRALEGLSTADRLEMIGGDPDPTWTTRGVEVTREGINYQLEEYGDPYRQRVREHLLGAVRRDE